MTLRISLNINKIEGPYGGGNHFAHAFENNAIAMGHTVTRTLEPNLDVILIISAKPHHITTAYTLEEIATYLRRYPNTVVVARVNACDEQKEADIGIARAWEAASDMADTTVFVSEFMRKLYRQNGFPQNRQQLAIQSGADEAMFHPESGATWNGVAPLKIITHHWSTSATKGFDIYERLDALLDTSPYKDKFSFTYLGRTPLGLILKNTRIVDTLSGKALATELKQHHVYLSAARYEPAGYHYIEAMRCGLPVLYLDNGTLRSGSLPEYCAPYGLAFNLADFEQKLLEMCEQYSALHEKVQDCPYTATRMCHEYIALMEDLVKERRAHPRPEPGTGERMQIWLRQKRRALGRIRRGVCSWLAG